jgi:uncharacterized protein YjbI with pentapeptide repeats
MSIFNIICNNINVKFDNGFTYQNFIGQFQKHSSKILCIVNEKILHIYDKNDKYPELVKFVYTKKKIDIDEFYFKNINNDLYCFFGQEALTFLNINDINSYNATSKIEQSKSDIIQIEQSKSDIIQIEQSKSDIIQIEQSKSDIIQIEQSKVDLIQIEQSKVDLSQIKQSKADLIQIEQSKVDLSQIKQSKADLSQIKQSKADLIQIERLQIEQSKNNNNQLRNNESINNNQLRNNQLRNNQLRNNQLRNNQLRNNDIKSINIDGVKYLNVSDRIEPNIITIIDKGEKLLFTNYNYEIHITEFE